MRGGTVRNKTHSLTGVEVSPTNGKAYVNTVGAFANLADPANGGIYALTKEDISNNELPPPVDSDLGALDGLDLTAGGVHWRSG